MAIFVLVYCDFVQIVLLRFIVTLFKLFCLGLS